VSEPSEPAIPARLGPLDRTVVGLNAIGSLWVLLLVLLINVDAFGRTFFNQPIAGMIEIVAVSLAVIVFCQLADTIRLGKLTRSDALLARMARSSRLGRTVVAGFEMFGALVMILIIVGTFPLLLQSYERGYFIGVRGVFTFPDWPVKAVVLLGALAALLCFLVRARRLWLGEIEAAGGPAAQREE
jgi:TRAP-type mannitol/chloroaromatic compound transport system permease small subunit